jgi:uncharacterized protein YeaO (DUF488 family)
VDDNHKAIIRLARVNVAESQQLVHEAREATRKYNEFCERVRQQIAADLAVIESLKAAYSRTGIIRS